MVINQEVFVDLNKPLAFQVGHLGEAYEEWVHQSIISKESPRLFENGVLELLMCAPWWTVPLVWLPVACLFVSLSIRCGIPLNQVALTTVAGILIWTLLEYLLHRFLFHFKPTSYCGITLHFILHGTHHKHPMDNLRLVIPPAPATIVALIVWNLIKLIVGAPYSYALFGGALMGYVVYDCTHYYVHHGKPFRGHALYELKRYHMSHHFKYLDKGFGVTTTFWDWLFGTLPPKC